MHESILQAQKVKIEDIPLPSADMPAEPYIPLMPIIDFSSSVLESAPPPPPPPQLIETTTTVISAPPKSILKPNPTNKEAALQLNKDLINKFGPLPGPPSGNPPDLNEFECDDDELELGLSAQDESFKLNDKNKKIRFNNEPAAPTPPVLPKPVQAAPSVYAQPKQITQPYIPSKPPPPPPAVSSTTTAATYAQAVAASFQRPQQAKTQAHHHQPPAPPLPQSGGSSQATTIVGAPVLRNKIAELTRFVPTSVLVRRDASSKPAVKASEHADYQSRAPYDYMSHQQQQYASFNPLQSKASAATSANVGNKPSGGKLASTDAAYDSFMKEIEKLL